MPAAERTLPQPFRANAAVCSPRERGQPAPDVIRGLARPFLLALRAKAGGTPALRGVTRDPSHHRDRRCERSSLPRLAQGRSEEHTSELQSLLRISYAVFCLKKKQILITTRHNAPFKTRYKILSTHH